MNKSKTQMLKAVISHSIGILGSSFLSFGISLYVLKVTKSALSFGMTMFVGPLIALLLAPVVGYVVDRYDRKKIIIAAQTVSIIALVIYAFTYQNDEYLVYITVALLSVLKVCDIFLSNSFNASTTMLVDREDVAGFTSYNQLLSQLSGILAPFIGGFLYALIDFRFYILIEAVLELVPVLINMTLDFNYNKKENEAAELPSKVLESFKAGVAYIKKDERLFSVMSFAIVINFVAGFLTVGLMIIFVKLLNIPERNIGFIEMAEPVGVIIASLLLGKTINTDVVMRTLHKKVFRLAFILGAMILLIALPIIVPMGMLLLTVYYIIVFVMTGIVVAGVNIPMSVFFQVTIEDGMKGRVFAALNALSMCMVPISILFYTFCFEHFDEVYISIGTGIFTALSGIMFYVKNKKYISADKSEEKL